jgi:hypothetical protein
MGCLRIDLGGGLDGAARDWERSVS